MNPLVKVHNAAGVSLAPFSCKLMEILTPPMGGGQEMLEQ
ncbi:hypothetical protein EV13_1866 [Prochlorococcus sp. MIT 0702]|nr:hypothetical protein EV13_1866 [Prochlorococcus sp. MIT 0702]